MSDCIEFFVSQFAVRQCAFFSIKTLFFWELEERI